MDPLAMSDAQRKEMLIDVLKYLAGELPDGIQATVYSGKIDNSLEGRRFRKNEIYAVQREGMVGVIESRIGEDYPTLKIRTFSIDEFAEANCSATLFGEVLENVKSYVSRNTELELPGYLCVF
jgi:hypothetical protein